VIALTSKTFKGNGCCYLGLPASYLAYVNANHVPCGPHHMRGSCGDYATPHPHIQDTAVEK
jgi:hypothetical protein